MVSTTAPSSDGKREQREGITIARFWVPIVCDKKKSGWQKNQKHKTKRNLHNIFPLYFVVKLLYMKKKSIWSHLKNNNDPIIYHPTILKKKQLKNLKNRNKNKNNDPIKTRKHTFWLVWIHFILIHFLLNVWNVAKKNWSGPPNLANKVLT